MNARCQMFKRACNSSIKCLELCPSGILIDGITNFQHFSNQIRQFFGKYTEIIQLSPSLSFISVNLNYKNFFKDFNNTFFLYHYDVFSIFPKKSYINQIINSIDEVSDIGNFQNDLYYLCFQNYSIPQNHDCIQNLKDIKVASSLTSSAKYIFYGFNAYSDLIDAYIMMIQNQSNWPIFSLFPSHIDKLQKKLFQKCDFIKETSAQKKIKNTFITKKIKDDFPQFNPNKFLFYVSFIEPNVVQHQRIRNVDEMYNIKHIKDVQISCTYKENSKDTTIRTFLGFSSEFRCLHVFDYFLHLSKTKLNSYSNVILVNESKKIDLKVRYDLYYIEIPKNDELDASLIYSFNSVEVISSPSSFFFGFSNYQDFESAEKLLFKPSGDSTYIKDVKCIDPSEINELFDTKLASLMKKSKLSFLILRVKRGDLSKLKSYLKGNKLIEKEVNLKSDDDENEQKKFALIGFLDNVDRGKAFNSLNNSLYAKNYKCFYPEDKYGRPKIPSIFTENYVEDEVDEKESSKQIPLIEDTDANKQNENENITVLTAKGNEEEEAKTVQQTQNERSPTRSKGKASKRNKGKKANKHQQPQSSATTASSNDNNNINDDNSNDNSYTNNKDDNLSDAKNTKDSAATNSNESASIATRNVTLCANSSTNSTTTESAANNDNNNNSNSSSSDVSATSSTDKISASPSTGSQGSGGGGKKNKKNKKGPEPSPNNNSSDTSSVFNPDQSLIYFYFIEKEKARKISQGKEIKSLFGVKKCQDVQRYRKIPDSESNDLFTFFGFSKYDEATSGISVIKSKWLADGQVKIYEATKAYSKHQNPDDVDFEDIEELLVQSMGDPNSGLFLPDKKFNLNNVKVKTYKSIAPEPGSFYYSFNQLSVPNDVQLELKTQLNKIKALKNITRDLVPNNSTYEPHAFYFLNFKDSSTDDILKNILKSKNFEYYDDEFSYESRNFIHFDERLIPDSSIELFVHFISLILGVYEIKRKVFYRDSIVTMIFYEDIAEDYLLSMIEQYLAQEGLLFDSAKYSLKNSIYFKQDIVLQNDSDIKIINRELERIGLSPVKVEEEKILFFKPSINNGFIQKFTFIVLNSQQDKMKALNHLNPVLFKGKGSILKYNPSLFYIKYDPANFTSKDGFLRCIDDIQGVVELQQNVLSIENSIELTYIGFDSFDLLNKACYLLHSMFKSHNNDNNDDDDIDDDFDEFDFENDANELISENLTSL